MMNPTTSIAILIGKVELVTAFMRLDIRIRIIKKIVFNLVFMPPPMIQYPLEEPAETD